MSARVHQWIFTFISAAALTGCSGGGVLSRLTLAPSPHERYAEALRDTALDNTALARDWLTAADTALSKPLIVALPMRESGYFAADTPTATAYQFELQRGRRFSVEVTFDSVETAQLFVDLYEVRAEGAPERIASLTDGRMLAVDVRRDGTYLLRIQPELLRSGRYTVVQRTLASLIFPVTGLTAAAVQSEFGAARDAGRREHEGIDIFAARNTPVVAVADGTAQPGTNPLGGNVVWLRDRREPRSFYYAHLTRWAFEGTAAVRAGDVVGYVGNTGNARGTAPHLHFGIYARGAIDPLPFLLADDPVPPPHTNVDQMLAELVRISNARATLRAGTTRSAPVIMQLNRASLARVTGVTDSQLRVELPDQTSGYLDRSAVTVARSPLRQQRLTAGVVVREQPLATAPVVQTIDEPVTADVIGEFNGFSLVRPVSGLPGWVDAKQSPLTNP
jgi:murein DD-endopeptidase MepM/ murein hydrolase activator NlpD